MASKNFAEVGENPGRLEATNPFASCRAGGDSATMSES
jgi:hypothetical protein